MVKIKTMPKETAAELFRYLAEQEDFNSVEKIRGGDISAEDVCALMREVADELSREAAAELKEAYDVKSCKTLSKEAKDIISCLSPREERSLLSAFGLVEKK